MSSVLALVEPVGDGVDADTPLWECASRIASSGDSLLVVREGTPVGLLTPRSIIGRGWLVGETWMPFRPEDRWCRAGVACDQDVVKIDQSTSVMRALRMLARAPHRPLVVVGERGTALGVLGLLQVMRFVRQVFQRVPRTAMRLHPVVDIQATHSLSEGREAVRVAGASWTAVRDGEAVVGFLGAHELLAEIGPAEALLECGDLVQGEVAWVDAPPTLDQAVVDMVSSGVQVLGIGAPGRVEGVVVAEDVVTELAEAARRRRADERRAKRHDDAVAS